MAPVYIHLLLNHAPIVGLFVAILVLAWAVLRNKEELLSTGLIFVMLMSFSAFPVFLSGNAAEDSVENIAGISEAAIEEHEDAGAFSLWTAGMAFAMAGYAFVGLKRGKPNARKLSMMALGLSVLAFATMSWVGYTGGEIRHPELSGQAQQTAPPSAGDHD